MAVQSVEVQVSKEAYELAQKLVQFVAESKKALDDGWQLGSDLPVVLAAVMQDLIPAIQSLNAVAPGFQENPKAFVQALELGLTDMAFVFLKKG